MLEMLGRIHGGAGVLVLVLVAVAVVALLAAGRRDCRDC
jgi:hypothetical protein